MEVSVACPQCHPDYSSCETAYREATLLRVAILGDLRIFKKDHDIVQERRQGMDGNYSGYCQFCQEFDRTWDKAVNARAAGRYQEAHSHLKDFINMCKGLDIEDGEGGSRTLN